MNVQQTLIIAFLMMFGVSSAPRADAYDRYMCVDSSNDYKYRIGEHEETLDEIKRYTYRFNNSDESQQEKRRYIDKMLRILHREIESTSDRSRRGTMLYWIYKVGEYCGSGQKFSRFMRENRDRRSKLKKERTFWKKERNSINEQIIQKRMDRMEALRNGN